MMYLDKSNALYGFWASFGLPAFSETVPVDEDDFPEGVPIFPHITYENAEGSFGDSISLTGSVWYRESTWENAVKMTERISKFIGSSGVFFEYQGGTLWIRRGVPFSRQTGDPDDDLIKRVIFNIECEFISQD